jgi:hypothetical protein
MHDDAPFKEYVPGEQGEHDVPDQKDPATHTSGTVRVTKGCCKSSFVTTTRATNFTEPEPVPVAGAVHVPVMKVLSAAEV